MKAAVLHEVNKPLVIEDVSLPKPGPDSRRGHRRVVGTGRLAAGWRP